MSQGRGQVWSALSSDAIWRSYDPLINEKWHFRQFPFNNQVCWGLSSNPIEWSYGPLINEKQHFCLFLFNNSRKYFWIFSKLDNMVKCLKALAKVEWNIDWTLFDWVMDLWLMKSAIFVYFSLITLKYYQITYLMELLAFNEWKQGI